MQATPTFSGELSRSRSWSLSLSAGYTFNRNIYERDINNQGLDFNTYTPRHILRPWITYRLPGACSAVWSSYVRYQINRQWQASLTLNNMFDKRCYTLIGNLVNSSHHGNPRKVMLTLRGSF
ncbi:hypothetical protein [Comamonas testosteroni]|uniref:hypothetical protein n=1 Tax=Comamonas testosteroni TaxID=285 RepID=UPI001E32EE25|nr:hypothetical protein [Comamonas testosteroni]